MFILWYHCNGNFIVSDEGIGIRSKPIFDETLERLSGAPKGKIKGY